MITTSSQSMLDTLKISASRVKSLSDGVIAIVITLLILNIKLPDAHAYTSNSLLGHALLKLGSSFFTYALSFLLIARYWIAHTVIFSHIEKIDIGLIWITILFLLALSFLPFPTELMGYYPHTQIAVILFDISISLPSLFLLMSILYVQFSKHYEEEWKIGIFKKSREAKHIRQLGIIPAVALLSIILSFFSETVGVYAWLFLLVLKIIETMLDKKEARRRRLKK